MKDFVLNKGKKIESFAGGSAIEIYSRKIFYPLDFEKNINCPQTKIKDFLFLFARSTLVSS